MSDFRLLAIGEDHGDATNKRVLNKPSNIKTKQTRVERVSKGQQLKCLLANTNVSDFAFVDQFLEFLPCRIRICSKFLIQDVMASLLECDWPSSFIVKKCIVNMCRKIPVDEIQIKVTCVKL